MQFAVTGLVQVALQYRLYVCNKESRGSWGAENFK